MTAHLPDLKKMLQGRGSGPGMQTSFGVLDPPLGSLRLKAAEMVLVLVMVDDTSIRQGRANPIAQLVSGAMTTFLRGKG